MDKRRKRMRKGWERKPFELWVSDVCLLETKTSRANEALVFRRFTGEPFSDKRCLCNHSLPALFCNETTAQWCPFRSYERVKEGKKISVWKRELRWVERRAKEEFMQKWTAPSFCILWRLPDLMTRNSSASGIGRTFGNGTSHFPAFSLRFCLTMLLSTFARSVFFLSSRYGGMAPGFSVFAVAFLVAFSWCILTLSKERSIRQCYADMYLTSVSVHEYANACV